MKNLLFTILLLLTSIGMQAQCGPGNPICSYGPVTVASGATAQLPSNGGLVPGFQFVFSSGSGTVVTAGCIGTVATGCVTLDSYSGGTTVRTPDEFSVKAPSAPYQYFTITPTFGAGTFTVLEVNNNTASKGGSSSSSVSLTASLPIVVTPNPTTGIGVISCPTCGTNSLSVAGVSGDVQGNNGSANLSAVHINDNATTMTVTESITPLVAAAKRSEEHTLNSSHLG